MSFTLSSSSESEDDDDRITCSLVSLPRNTEFIRQFKGGSYNAHAADNWPNELHNGNHHHHHANPPHANHSSMSSPLVNGFGNFSITNDSHQLNGPRILDSSAILNTTPEDDIVLIQVGDKYRQVRVIKNTKLIQSAGTPEQRPLQNINIKIESPPDCKQQAAPLPIPLDRIDYTTIPCDPRKDLPDYCYINRDEDSFPWTLPLPRFWREVLRRIEQNVNQERTMNGKPKFPTSYIKNRVLQQTQGFGQRPDPRRDPRRNPRLEQTLFPQPPHKATSSHNESAPNLKTSIFDVENTEEVLSDWSSTLSFSSDNESGPSNKRSQSNGNLLLSELSDDDDKVLSFTAFNKRQKDDVPIISKNEKDSPIQFDLKKDERKKSDTLNGTKNLLLEKPPLIDKDDILKCLTDNESDDDENCTEIVPIATTSKVNGVKIRRAHDKKKTVTEKIESKPTETKRLRTRAGATKKDDKKKKSPLKKTRISAVSRLYKHNTTDPGGARTKAKIDDANKSIGVDSVVTLKKTDANAVVLPPAVSSKNSDTSTTSAGSIERRLSEMISPVKTATKTSTNQQLDEKLTDILSRSEISEAPKQTEHQTNNVSDHNSSTQSEPSPLFECIPESECANTSVYNQMPDLTSDSLQLQDSNENMLNSTTIADAKKSHPPTDGPKDVQKAAPLSNRMSNDVSDTTPVPMDIELPDLLLELNADPINNNIFTNTSLDIAAFDEICAMENLDKCTNDLNPLDILGIDHTTSISTKKNGVKQSKKVKRAKVIIVEMDFFGYNEKNKNIVAMDIPMNSDFDSSDDDFEDDVPCKMDEITLPNSNTDRNAVDKLKSTCNLCQYQAAKGWKQLTKHYVRKHPNCEIPISRLAKDKNPFQLSISPSEPQITENSTGLMIKSLCQICDEVYDISSEKWLNHFIAHTGEYEFRCKSCQQEISQDLHKKCNSMNNDRINTHSFVDNVLYGYVCMQCKYVQLSKENVKKHLDREHQQINPNDENIVEIILLKSSAKMYLMDAVDSKLEKNLVEAKQRVHEINQNDDDVITAIDVPISDDDDGDEIACIDLTLSDEE